VALPIQAQDRSATGAAEKVVTWRLGTSRGERSGSPHKQLNSIYHFPMLITCATNYPPLAGKEEDMAEFFFACPITTREQPVACGGIYFSE